MSTNINQRICLFVLVFTLLEMNTSAFKLFNQEQSSGSSLSSSIIKPNPPLNADDTIQKGGNITEEVADFIKKQTEFSYLMYRYDAASSVALINQKLRQTYPGQWMVCLVRSNKTGVTPIPTKDFSMATSSYYGSWWYYGRGINHYWQQASYFITRIWQWSANWNSYNLNISSNILQKNYTYFSNIVDGVQSDTTNVQIQASVIKPALQVFDSNFTGNVIVGNQVLYDCRLNQYTSDNYYVDNINGTTKNKYNVGAFLKRMVV